VAGRVDHTYTEPVGAGRDTGRNREAVIHGPPLPTRGFLGERHAQVHLGAGLPDPRRPGRGPKLELEPPRLVRGGGGEVVIKVAIVEDHPVARHGLVSILAAAPDIQVVAAVTDITAFTHRAPSAVDAVIYDSYPYGETPRLGTITTLWGFARVLVVTASRQATDALAAMHCGASGYLSKDAIDEACLSAVRRVAAVRCTCRPGWRGWRPPEVCPARDGRPAPRPRPCCRCGNSRHSPSSPAATPTSRSHDGWGCPRPLWTLTSAASARNCAGQQGRTRVGRCALRRAASAGKRRIVTAAQGSDVTAWTEPAEAAVFQPSGAIALPPITPLLNRDSYAQVVEPPAGV
jgi:hypothetical protein